MAFEQILASYDLSGGGTFSSVVDLPANVNLGWKTENATDTDQIVELEWQIQVGEEEFHVFKRDNKTKIIVKTRGNESDNLNVFSINATKLKIKVTPPAAADGTLILWALNN